MKGKEGFEEYYSSLYKERWPQLKESLLKKDKQVYRETFSHADRGISWLGGSSWSDEEDLSLNEHNSHGLKKYYLMDPASVLIARSLGVSEGDRVLDMCAAPGGKSLVLIESANGVGEFWLNEPSKPRRERLTQVVREYLPEQMRRNVFVKGKDGLRYGMIEEASFDKILLDAPCSSERHVLKSEKDLNIWSIKRTKGLAKKQYGLLCSALLALRSGGELIYSTCSISPLENEEVIQRLLDRKSDQFEIVAQEWDVESNSVTHGSLFTPDISGFGPMYCCKIKKK